MKVEDLANRNLTIGQRPERGKATFLPDPERRARRYTIVSVDDHLVEPPHLFDGRMAGRYAAQAPRVVEDDEGNQAWTFAGQLLPNVGLNAVAGRPILECSFEPQRFDEMRRGAWDIHERVRDMDLDGVYASLNFPSALVGFAGQRLQQLAGDADLALALVRAINDWHLEEWAGSYPERIIPCQIPYLLDGAQAAAEVRANAARGFKAIAFSEAPEKLGLPSLHTGYWDPLMAACEETGTVVCLHVGSSSEIPSTAPDAPPDTIGVLFFGYAMFAAVDWLYSLIPVRFPGIKIAMSEGGLAWVPGLIDRLDHVLRYHEMYGTWTGIELTPAEVFRRNFWHCALDDPSCFQLKDRIGVEHIMVEADYPHLDSSWPNTQEIVHRQVGTFPDAEVRRFTWQNASELFGHPVPESVVTDPEWFSADSSNVANQ